ncbi:MAG: hypothetical protein ACYTBJ_13085 [Planctomycetota bacterium]|jgi:hypothetical protein
MKPDVLSSTLIRMASHKYLRKLPAKRIDDCVDKSIVQNGSQAPESKEYFDILRRYNDRLEHLPERIWETE